MEFQSNWTLLLLLILPVMAYLQMHQKKTAAVKFPSLNELKKGPTSWRVKLLPMVVLVRYICIILLIIAFARPRKGTTLSEKSTEGVVIEVVVDHSGSMGEEMDYFGQRTNRLEVAKKVFADFIGGNKELPGREGDFVGLITFARFADTICPVVRSHDLLVNFLKKTDLVKIREEDGTAIGDAIALAAARLKKAEEEIQRRKIKLLDSKNQKQDKTETDFKIKNKIIILLTDGQNNAGDKSPLEAAKLAKKWGIKIYTIGIGSSVNRRDIFGMTMRNQLDEKLLKTVAQTTGGFYGKATDAHTLYNVVEKIDDMEKTKIKSVEYTEYEEKFWYWAFAAMVVLGFEILGRCTVFRKIP